jgi:hypothetical protein
MPEEDKTQKNTGNSTLIIVIVVIVVGIIILGVGGYFGWKYLASKYLTKNTPASTSTTTPSSSITTNLSTEDSSLDDSSNTTTTKKSTDTSNSKLSNDYIIADSDSRLIATSELIKLTPWQLKVARNEIYARHGRPFVHQDLQCYFNQKSWYNIDQNFSNSMLSVLENKNIQTILDYENKINSPILQKDTGCNTN